MSTTIQIFVLISELVIFLAIYAAGPVVGMWTMLLLWIGLPLYIVVQKTNKS
jgi:hypothetical protein